MDGTVFSYEGERLGVTLGDVEHVRPASEWVRIAHTILAEAKDLGVNVEPQTVTPHIIQPEETETVYLKAVELVRAEGKVSTSFIQRRLEIGYNAAARLIERMETEGLVSRVDRLGKRSLLATE